MAQWFSCNGCSGSDPTSDTVKVDASLLAAAGKENVQPMPAPQKAHELQKAWEEQDKRAREQQAAEEQRQAEEHAKRRREAEAAKQRQEEEWAAEREAAERARMQRVAAEAAAKAKEEQQRLDEQRAAEDKARAEREAADKAAKERENRAAEKVTAWCKKKGFQDMNTKMSSLFSGSKFPLHAAVADKDVEMVGLMVLLGVDETATNSKGQTAKDLAAKLNKKGSMEAILASLK